MSTTFKVDQQVVYPTHGVGQITEIKERMFKGEPTPYYTIYIEVSDMTIMIPVNKAEERGIRAIVPKSEAEKALKLIEGEYEVAPADWKMRYEMNRQLLLKGSVTDIAQVVQTLYHRSKIKELPILERKLYDSAIKLLVDELSISLKKDRTHIEEMIFERLETEPETPEVEEEAPKTVEDDFDAGVDEDDIEVNEEG
ncbi:CarD family transcriptional regulator [Salinispira pacifica]|uniref:CarD-like transcriptional regulator n=1 Tax=Salinispira pacifica TaxID=1307761 RepID=V5WN47_9SPIO|nr:CarD family transcriptional regulator [Salinispira pacifica]AHC16609.1 CarD-like transcriptional regulator [Salinispira pacifica]